MEVKFSHLPKYTFDQLSERVCNRLDLFNGFGLKTANMWEGIPELCERIDAEPRTVDSVIPEVMEKFPQAKGLARKYNTVLTRVYVLLYYRYCDDSLFQDNVFPRLIEAMGVYAKDNPLKTIIQPKIKEIIELDKLVEKAREEKMKEKNVKPIFAFEYLSGIELDHLFDDYNDERLFRELSGIIKNLSAKYATNLDETLVWYNAKKVVHALRDVKHPELFIERAASALVPGQIRHEYQGSQIVLLCAYAMARSAKENPHFDKFISTMEQYGNEDADVKMNVLREIKPIRKLLDDKQPFDDYDYIGESVKPEYYTADDMKRALAEYQTKIQELMKEKEGVANEVSTLNARIKDLEEDNKRLQTELDNSKTGEGENEEEINPMMEKIIVELLAPLFKNNDCETARAFYRELIGQDDKGVINVVVSHKEDYSIKMHNVDLYRILHAFNLYSATETNFNTALRKNNFRNNK